MQVNLGATAGRQGSRGIVCSRAEPQCSLSQSAVFRHEQAGSLLHEQAPRVHNNNREQLWSLTFYLSQARRGHEGAKFVHAL